MTQRDDRFMQRALDLAREPAFTSPNPRVGAVVVRDGRVVGEGAHRGPGTPHAEAGALADVDARGASLYVTLEPCVHRGLTPPCVPLVLAAGIARVVVSLSDPDQRVAGRGLAALREAGVEVETGVLERETRILLVPYLHHRSTGRSFLTLKLALSLDGRLAAGDGSARWISDPEARRLVHAHRVEADAVLVGAGTIAADDPALTARDSSAPRQPVRVIVDSSGRTSATARALTGAGPVLVATGDRAPHEIHTAWKEAGAEVLVLPAGEGGVSLPHLMEELGRRGFVETLCEGGATLASAALRAGVVGRIEVHRGPVLLGSNGIGLGDLGVGTMDDAARWELLDHRAAGDTIVATYGKRD